MYHCDISVKLDTGVALYSPMKICHKQIIKKAIILKAFGGRKINSVGAANLDIQIDGM